MPEHQQFEVPAVDTLQISVNEWDSILSKLEEENKNQPTDDRRAQERHTYRNILGLILEMADAGESMSNFLIKSRNISRAGLSFFHGQELPVGTPCVVTLVKANFTQDRCHGSVAHCRQVAGRVHEIGIQFDQPINLSSYLAPANPIEIR